VSRLGLALVAAVGVAATGCAQLLRDLPGGRMIGERLDRNAEVVGGNLVGMVASGEISKTAAFDMEQEHYLGKTVAASVLARVGGPALPPEHPVARYLREGGRGTAVASVLIGLRSAAARERQERQQAELVATVAHELRSPLTSVKGFTATLLAKWERFTDAQRRLMLETVEADADRVTRLLTELLDVARIDAGRLELHRSLVDLAAAVRRQVEGMVAGGEPAERFVVRVEGPLPETWADADKVDQVLANLLDNAVRHGSGTVTATLAAVDGGTSVTVDDEGPGVPPEQAELVFTRFWRGSRLKDQRVARLTACVPLP